MIDEMTLTPLPSWESTDNHSWSRLRLDNEADGMSLYIRQFGTFGETYRIVLNDVKLGTTRDKSWIARREKALLLAKGHLARVSAAVDYHLAKL